MRGRRRGRNRPSPLSSPPAGSSSTPAPGAQGTVKVLETEQSVDAPSAGTGEPQEAVETVDRSADAAAPERMASGSVADAAEDAAGGLPDEQVVGESDEGTPPTVETAEPADAAQSADVAAPAPVEPVTSAPSGPPTAEGSDGPTGDGVDKAPAADDAREVGSGGETEEPAVAPGRQPQAASGNPLPRVLAVANQKGGVGKTTTSVNLGAALAELGYRVLVIDLDPQGNATTGLGIDARNFELSMYDVLMRDASLEDCVEPTSMKNLFVAPATIALAGAEIELVPAFSRELKLKRAIESVIDDFDYVLIDCPPSLGLITVNALAAADEVLVPIQCEYYALEGLSQLMRNVHLVASNLNPRLDISTIVLTMYDARTKLADQVATEVRDHFGNKVCRIVIPRTVRLSEAPSFGQPITAFDPASRGAIAYRELAKEVSGGTS